MVTLSKLQEPGQQSSALLSGTNRKMPAPARGCALIPSITIRGCCFSSDLVRWTQPPSFTYNYLVLPASMPFLFFPHPPASIQQSLPEDWIPRIFLFAGVGVPSPFLPLPVRVWLSINLFFHSYLMSICSLSSCSHWGLSTRKWVLN